MHRLIFLILLFVGHVSAADPKSSNLWSKINAPLKGASKTFGSYANGCFRGGSQLPLEGDGYEVIRQHRNRYYGHAELIQVVEWIAAKNREAGGETLLIGDLSQPAGGPMPFGHRSHQLGLDADIWFTNVPETQRNEDASFPRLVDLKEERVDPQVWKSEFVRLLKTAASHPRVERVFVNWIIKKHLCETETKDLSWLKKIRPWWGHDRHFHVRLSCPKNAPNCRNQPPSSGYASCGGETWFSDAEVIARRKKEKPSTKPKKKPVLPKACREMIKKSN